MKKIILTVSIFLFGSLLFSQEKMLIHKTDKITLGANVADTDSAYFTQQGQKIHFKVGEITKEFYVTQIDSISFGENSNTVEIIYNQDQVTIINPFAFQGVEIYRTGAKITVISNNEIRDIDYKLSGSTSNGYFKIYSEKRFNLLLNGVNITNEYGPAINIQSSTKSTVYLVDNTQNTLSDGTSYDEESEEDQKGTFFSEGQLIFTGQGSLTLSGFYKHALCSDDYIKIESGNITVSKAATDAIHAKDYFTMENGNLTLTSAGDGIDSEGRVTILSGNLTINSSAIDAKAISCDSTLLISGGVFNVTVTGNQSKAFKSDGSMFLNGGVFTVKTSGNVVLATSGSGFDPSYCTAFKSDSSITVAGADITITSSGTGGKGFSSDLDFTMKSGNLNITTSGNGATYKNSSGVTDSYSATCITTDGNATIFAGTIVLKSSGSAGKGISVEGTLKVGDSANNPQLTITTTGAKFLVSGSDYAHPKAMKSTGILTIDNGILVINSSDDGIYSPASIIQNGGSIDVQTAVEGIESKYIIFNNGTAKVNATNDGLNATAGTVAGGTESNDGSSLTVNGGFIVFSSPSGDAIDSNGNIYINGGTMLGHGPTSGMEEDFDFNGNFVVSGGFLISSGTSSNMNKPMSSATTQYSMFLKSSSQISAGTIFHIQDASGNDIVTFKALRASYSYHFTSSALKSGVTYSIYVGGSSTGTLNNGLYSGGVYTAGTLKKTFTLSSKVTTLSF